MKTTKTLRQAASESVIIGAMAGLAEAIKAAAERSVIGSLLTSYDSIDSKRAESFTAEMGEKLASAADGGRLKKLRRSFLASFEQSRILGFVRTGLRALLGCPLKYYGMFMLIYGIVISLIQGTHILLGEEPDMSAFALAAGTIICAFVALAENRSLAELICRGKLASWIVFDAVGARRESYEEVPVCEGRYTISVLLGVLAGGITYIVHPLIVTLIPAVLGVLYAILCIPEFGVVLIIFAAPFLGAVPHPSIASAAIVLYIAFCTFIKVVRGKRSISFELSDGIVLLFLLLTLLGGFFSVSRSDSLSYGVIYAVLMASYFLVVILIRTEKWVKRCVVSLISSCTIVSLYGIYQNYLGTASTTWQDTEMFSEMGGRITSTFENPNVLAEYLIMCLPFIMAMFFIRVSGNRSLGRTLTPDGRRGSALLAAFCIAAAFAALIFTMSRGAWLGFMIGALVFLLIYSGKTLVVCCFGLLGIPFLPFVLPESIIKRFTSIGDVADSSTAYRVHIWEGCINMIKDCFGSGIGVGKDVFSLVYPSYTLAGIESAPHAHNLYLQIIIELGIFGILTFLAAAFVTAQLGFSFFSDKRGYDERAYSLRLYSAAALSGLIAVAAQGMTDYIWYNYRVFLVFWLLAGIVSAARRCAKREYGICEISGE